MLSSVSQALQIAMYATIGLLALAASMREQRSSAVSKLRLAVGSLMLLGVPPTLSRWASGHVSGVSGTVVFSLAPVLTAILVAHASDRAEHARGHIGPGLVGVGGLLLLVPFSLPRPAIGLLSLGAYLLAAILVSVFGIWMHRLLRAFHAWDATAVICISNAVFLCGVSFFGERLRWHWDMLSLEAVLAAGLALVQLLLFIWLLREAPPIRLAGRFLLVPLLTIIEGYIVLRPEVNVRMVAGLLALAVGTMWILFSNAEGDTPSLSLR
jgi:drug/metabolite transporter (DMT)-like permease